MYGVVFQADIICNLPAYCISLHLNEVHEVHRFPTNQDWSNIYSETYLRLLAITKFWHK